MANPIALMVSRPTPQFIGYIVVLDVFSAIGPDAFTYAVLGLAGSLIGSFVRIVKRDEADIDDKVKFFYLKDLFKILTWSLVGAFFPLVFAAQGWYPWIAVACSPFTPKLWDTMEEFVPQILRTALEKFTTAKKETTSETDITKETKGKK